MAETVALAVSTVGVLSSLDSVFLGCAGLVRTVKTKKSKDKALVMLMYGTGLLCKEWLVLVDC